MDDLARFILYRFTGAAETKSRETTAGGGFAGATSG